MLNLSEEWPNAKRNKKGGVRSWNSRPKRPSQFRSGGPAVNGKRKGDPMNNEQMEEIKRHVGVVAEGLEHTIQLVAEGVANLDEKLEGFRQEITEEFKEVKSRLSKTGFNQRLLVCNLLKS